MRSAYQADKLDVGRIEGRGVHLLVEFGRVAQGAHRHHATFLNRAVDHPRRGKINIKLSRIGLDRRALDIQNSAGGDGDAVQAFGHRRGQVEHGGIVIHDGDARGGGGPAVEHQVGGIEAGDQHRVVEVDGERRRACGEPLAIGRIGGHDLEREHRPGVPTDLEHVFALNLIFGQHAHGVGAVRRGGVGERSGGTKRHRSAGGIEQLDGHVQHVDELAGAGHRRADVDRQEVAGEGLEGIPILPGRARTLQHCRVEHLQPSPVLGTHRLRIEPVPTQVHHFAATIRDQDHGCVGAVVVNGRGTRRQTAD